jgi:hypothetical protein
MGEMTLHEREAGQTAKVGILLVGEGVVEIVGGDVATAGGSAGESEERARVGVSGLVFQSLFQRGFGGIVFALMKFFDAFGDGILSEGGGNQQ